MTTAEPPAVAIEGVSHCYGRRQALNDVTFSIAPSTFAVLLGNYETNLLAKSASDLADFHTRQDHAPRFAGKGQGNCTLPLTRIEPSTFRISFLTPVMRNGPHLCREHARRPMVTIIRASRARCVNATIPRHERAVLTARHPARAGRAPGTGSDGAPTWPKCWHKSAVRASTGD